MGKKMTLTKDNLRLTASYLNLNNEGQALLEKLTSKLAEIPVKPEQMNSEQLSMSNEKSEIARNS